MSKEVSGKYVYLKALFTKYRGGGGGGGGKSQYPYVGLNNSVTECTIEIILSGMTYYHHWFKEFVNSKHIYLCSFFSNEDSFSHLFDSLDTG